MNAACILKKKAIEKTTNQGLPNFDTVASNNTQIIAKNASNSNQKNLSAVELLNEMLLVLEPTDLIKTLTNSIGDELQKYKSKEGDIQATKIPRSLYIVAVLEELKHATIKYGWSMAQRNGMLYLYNKTYWQRVNDDDVKNFLSLATIRLGYYSPADAKTHIFAEAAYKQFITSTYFPMQEKHVNLVLINLENGTYEVTATGGELREHRKEDFLTYCLPFCYDESAEAPLFQRYLDRVLPDRSSQMLLQEFHGYIFIKHLKLEKALVLFGTGQNGKSVQFEITTSLLGESNVATKSLGDLVNHDSGGDNRAKLQDKLVNYGSEIHSKGIEVDIFKRLVSGEPVSAREKYKTSFDLRNNCKFIFNANKLPVANENTEAFFRRFIIIPYEVLISDDEKDPELHTKIIANELPGVLNWAITGLHRLLSNKKFSYSEAANNALLTYKKESSSVAMMLDEEGFIICYNDTEEHRMSNKVLYSLYKDYCTSNGMYPHNSTNFSKELIALGYKSYRKSQERGFLIAKAV